MNPTQRIGERVAPAPGQVGALHECRRQKHGNEIRRGRRGRRTGRSRRTKKIKEKRRGQTFNSFLHPTNNLTTDREKRKTLGRAAGDEIAEQRGIVGEGWIGEWERKLGRKREKQREQIAGERNIGRDTTAGDVGVTWPRIKRRC